MKILSVDQFDPTMEISGFDRPHTKNQNYYYSEVSE